MNRLVLKVACLAIGAPLLFAAVPAIAATVDFTGAAVNSYDPVPQGYGDTAAVDLAYRTLNGGNNWGQSATQLSSTVSYWAVPNYSGDNAIFPVATGNKGELTLTSLLPGQVFSSVSFSFGAFPDTDLPVDYRIFDANWNTLANVAGATILGTPAGLIVALNALNTSTLRIQWGDNWNTGLRSVSFDLSEVQPGATPIPGALPLFASGLGALGLLGWRRKRKQMAA